MIKACMKEEDNADIPTYNVPSKVLCKVVDVELKAFPDSDEVFAEIVLLPDTAEAEGLTSFGSVPEKIAANAFRKILTTSDASTHGGCGLPKSSAEKTFPPMYSLEDQECQYIMGKDIHGATWHFQHTYRGSPRRHILCNGWNKFVSEKKLKAGDTCIFMRGLGPNEIYIGIQRAAGMHKKPTDVTESTMEHGVLIAASIAIWTRNKFSLIYRPRMCVSAFIVSYDKVMEALKLHYLPGMRFEMLIDGQEDHELTLKRYSGTITEMEDIDPGRWPHSEWRCLKVRWDVSPSNFVLPPRVSPWEIRPLNPDAQPSISIDRKRSIPFEPIIRRIPFARTSENSQWGGCKVKD